MDVSELAEPFSRLIEEFCSPAAVRSIENGGDAAPMWVGFVESGFLDALVSEENGGAGLSLREVAPLWALLGRHAVPLPVGETMIARALLSRTGAAAPVGPVAIVTGAHPTPFAAVAAHFLTGTPDMPIITSAAAVEATGVFGSVSGSVPLAYGEKLRPLTAVLRALLISGATDRVLEMTVRYANERSQFGRPIGKQQAIQQQLAVLAEQAVAARIAAAIGIKGELEPRLVDAAVAKHGASLAAIHVATIAHAVHGAIGISEEYDLQLLTRRLHEWRLADGSEGYWAQLLGRERASRPSLATTDFIRAE